ncbi:MAG: tetratricopeptide repeat protein [Verrucomicrobiota bacterium]|nr:tetratricopeptide repeat protein [Verrucomicrobiota bacterium]
MTRRLVFYLVLPAMAVCAFGNSLAGRFVFDDIEHIIENPYIRSMSPPWGPLFHTSRPAVQWSLALNYEISGLAPWSYHVLNGLIHLAAACVMLGVLRRIFALQQNREIAAAADGLALASAVLWLVHPLQTESVTYVIQRGESLMGLFCLLTLYAFIRSLESKRVVPWQSCSVLCCILGLTTKPIMAIAPLLVLIYDRTFVAHSFRAAWQARWRYYLALFATLALLPLILAGKTAEWAPTAGFSFESISPLTYAATQPEVMLRYLRLTFWPDALCLDYGWHPETRWTVIALSTAMIVALLGLSLREFRRRSALGFAGAWFFLTLAPTSSFIPIADLIYEHRMYLALAAVLSVAVAGAFVFLQAATRRFDWLAQRRTAVQFGTIAVVALLLTGRTVLRNDDYASEAAVWTTALEVSPDSPRAHLNLGTALAQKPRWTEAAHHFARAIEIRPNYAEAHYNLGNAQMALGDLPAAILSYRRALTITPNDWQTHNNFGVALLKAHRPEDAAAEFNRTLQLNPACASAHVNLGRIAQANGANDAAAYHFAQALLLQPDSASARAAASNPAPR